MQQRRRIQWGAVLAAAAAACLASSANAFSTSYAARTRGITDINRISNAAAAAAAATRRSVRSHSRLHVSGTTEEVTKMDLQAAEELLIEQEMLAPVLQDEQITLLAKLQAKIGSIDESRYSFPEYNSGEVPRLYSTLKYDKDGSSLTHAAGSVLAATAVVASTTVGAGALALPAATAAAGFLPSTLAMCVGYGYMVVSGLLLAELTLNRMSATGKTEAGLFDLYQANVPQPWAQVGSASYFFLQYSLLVACLAQGGVTVSQIVGPEVATCSGSSLMVGGALAASLTVTPKAWVEKLNGALSVGVFGSLATAIYLGAQKADFQSLVAPVNQHPDQIVNCFPIIFMAFVYQSIVPGIVTDLEGDRSKITKAIVGGTAVPFVMFLAWNAVVLGNFVTAPVTVVDPIALLQNCDSLGPVVSTFMSLAVVTSGVRVVYGLMESWGDVLDVEKESQELLQWRLPLMAAIFAPALALLSTIPNQQGTTHDMFMNALEYGGAFGVSTFFLVLPPVMAWKERYGEDQVTLATKPMVPLGKIPLGSMYKAAGTLILEQGAEKLGIFDAVEKIMSS